MFQHSRISTEMEPEKPSLTNKQLKRMEEKVIKSLAKTQMERPIMTTDRSYSTKVYGTTVF